jgi:outer membrane receptor protein involved in Fe transport
MFQRKRLNAAILAAITSAGASMAKAEIEEVVVTATKRAASTQDIPVAVSAVNEQTLEELGVSNFEDYLLQLPGVTAGGSGPGQNTIYIRGVASTTPNLTTAGVAGLAPNVALYLDEQPLSQPGRNLDVYTADMNRVEVLSGPQGTLFGASSQAGTVRLITNKPDPSGTYASVDFGTSWTEGGEMSNNVEGMINVNVSDDLTVRGVVYVDRQGGYIDNVPGTVTAEQSARFRPANTVRDNGVPVNAGRGGFQAGSDLSGVTFIAADNGNRVKDDFNDTTYAGGRISLLWAINDNWTLTVSHTEQELESDGVFFSDPDLDDYEVQRYADDNIEDSFSNTAWTFEGMIGELEVVYTGAYTDRETDQIVDYTDYLFVGQYLPYYICDGSVTYPSGAPSGTCNSPMLFVNSRSETEVTTHEFRIATDQTRRVRATAGAFYSDLELKELNDFTYPSSESVVGFNGVIGFGPNYPLTNTAVTGEVGNAAPGYFSQPGPFPEGVIFRNDVLRTDEQKGVFGEVTFDVVPDTFAVTLGARWYDIEVDLEGSANSSFFNLGQTTDAQAFGTNISAQFAPNNAIGAPDTASTDGTIFKVTGQWTPSDSALLYATWSEGFRPGLLNRPGGASNGTGYTVPYALDTDDVTNIELGWKADLLNYTLRFNGSVFFVDIENLQTTIFDPSIVNLFFSDNAADAEVRGVEGNFIWQPASVEGLSITGAFSFLDTEITKVITPTNDVIKGDELAFAPEFQANVRARYTWSLDSGLTAHVMPHVNYSAESYSDIITINRDKIDSWVMVGVTAGVSSDSWTAELFIDNLASEEAEVSRSFVFDRQRVTYARPRTVGMRVSYDF